MNMIRLKQCPIGATFIYNNVKYVKTIELERHKKDYNPNCIRLDNDKPIRLHGSVLVKVVEQWNQS